MRMREKPTEVVRCDNISHDTAHPARTGTNKQSSARDLTLEHLHWRHCRVSSFVVERVDDLLVLHKHNLRVHVSICVDLCKSLMSFLVQALGNEPTR